MYYKVNPQKLIRSLLIIYLIVISIVLSIGFSKGKDVEVIIGLETNDIIGKTEVIEVETDKIIEIEKTNIVSPFEMLEIGEFNVSGFTKEDRSSNEIMRDYEGVSVAADPEVIPNGTKVWIEGVGIRQVQPNTQNLEGNVIKVYFDTVEKKEAFGKKEIKIYKVIE